MDGERKKIIEGKPAPYPKTTPAETDSRNIFYSLIDTRFVKGEIRVSDKVPNSDGILDITDLNQIPIGKIDIQLKTLKPKNYKSPCFQCNISFFSYCEDSVLPVILVAVNRKDKKVYWRHIDEATLIEVAEKMTGNSCSISFPIGNFIDSEQNGYISAWTKLSKEVVDQRWNYTSLQKEHKVFESKLKEFENKLQNPTHLPLRELKSFHTFLDKFNYIMDMEFPSIKDILYPNYWKIGIGITRYEISDVRYFLYPIEYKKEQTLIKEVVFETNIDVLQELMELNMLFFVSSRSLDDIKNFPLKTAYKSLEDSILKIIENYNFPIANDFIANEYLISFIDRNIVYLDMDVNLEYYSLQDIKYKLFAVLPMLAANSKNFADWVTELDDDIDSYSGWKTSPHLKKRIGESIEKIKEGFIPKVKVTITSKLYNIDLIKYYINYLEHKGISTVNRIYKLKQFDENKYADAVAFKKTWNTEILWDNVKLFFSHFYQLYEELLNQHYPYIKNFLQITPTDSTNIILLITDEAKGGPYLEIYNLRPNKSEPSKLFFFVDTDSNNPIDRKKILLDDCWDCTLEGRNYYVTQMHIQTLEFMFELSPSYALINKKLLEKLKEFFLIKKKQSK